MSSEPSPASPASPAPPPRPASADPNPALPPKTYPYRFGEVGVLLGVLSREQVREALNQQKTLKAGGRGATIGELMVAHGWITPRQVASILVAQKRYRAASPPRTAAKAAAPAGGPPAPAGAAAPPTFKRLGVFELQRKLGSGAMGTVFQARDTQTQKTVALKLLPRELAQDHEFLERFKREVKTLGALNHPNIVAFHGAGQADGYWYLAMEYVDGESLSARLKRAGRLPEAEALRIARDSARALTHAHAQSLIHRDIKPENILLAKDGTVKVTDFGLAKSQQDTNKLTMAGFSIGTPYYLSPEQALGKEVDPRADLYALGGTLFHLLTGRVPFDHASSAQVMVMHVKEPPPDPRALVPSVTRNAAQLVMRLLAKEPQKRFAGAEALCVALERVMAGQPPGETAAPAAPAPRRPSSAWGTLWTRLRGWAAAQFKR